MYIHGKGKFQHFLFLFSLCSLLLALGYPLSFTQAEEKGKLKHLKTINLNSQRRYFQFLSLAVREKKIYLVNPVGAGQGRGLIVYDLFEKDTSRFNKARFTRPVDLAVVPQGEEKIYVVDTQRNQVSVFNFEGKPLFQFGKPGSGKGEFRQPYGIALNSRRKWIYLVDSGNSRVQVFDYEGNYLFGFAGLSSPQRISVDREGKVYVVEPLNCQVKIFDTMGTKLIKKFGDELLFGRPSGIAVDSQLNIYVLDTVLNTIQVFDSRGIPLYLFGKKGEADGEFNSPCGIFIDEKDRVYVADTNNQRVQIFEIMK